MAWFSGLIDGLSQYARSKIKQLESLFAKGLAPQQANHYVKESSAIDPSKRKGLLPWEAYQLWQGFHAAKEDSLVMLPEKRSERLYASTAVPTHFISPMGHRYLLDYSFIAIDPRTGEETVSYATMGFRRLARWGSILDRLNERAQAMVQVAEDGENYAVLQNKTFKEGSIHVTGFYRTQNR